MSLPDHIKSAIQEYLPVLEGWCEPDRACELAEIALELRPKTVVSLGVFGGRIEIAIGFVLRQNDNGGMVYGIDPWEKEAAIEGEGEVNRDWWDKSIDLDKIHTDCMHSIFKHRLQRWITIIRARSEHVHQLFPAIEMLIIDGNHSEEASCRDVRNYVPSVVSGGYVICDDTDWTIPNAEGQMVNTTKKAMELIAESCDLVRQSGNMQIYKKR